MQLEELVVPLKLDPSNYKIRMAEADKATKAFADNTAKRLKDVGGKFASLGKKMTLGLTVPIVAGLGASVLAAANLEQSIGSVESIFGSASKIIFTFSDNAAKMVGLSKRSFNELATLYGAMVTNMGFTNEEAANSFLLLSNRAADTAANISGTPKEVLDAYNSALKGSFDPLEKFGINITAATAKEEALNLGLIKQGDELDANSRALAVNSLFMKQTTKNIGAWEREQDSVTVQIEQARANIENMGAEIADTLLPIVSEILTKINEWVVSFSELDEETQTTILIILGLVAVAGPLLSVIGLLIKGVGFLTGAWSVILPVLKVVGAFIAGISLPVLALIAAIGLLIGVVIAFGADIKETWGGIWEQTKTIFGLIGDRIREKIEDIKSAFEGMKNSIRRAIDKVRQFFQPFIDKIKEIGDSMPDWLIPGSATPFEIGLKGVREEFVKISATADFPVIEGNGDVSMLAAERFEIDYERLGGTVANALAQEMG